MKIISYNVNGIRAAIKKGFLEWLKSTNCDVICLQEVKALKSEVPNSLLEDLGYQYHYWQPAQTKKGYSGVAIISKIEPQNVIYGYGNYPLLDDEGRVLRADFNDFSVLSVYMPSGSSGELRQKYKMEWMENFYEYIKDLLEKKPNLIIVGDYNICHQPIDIHNPKANAKTSGFLPEERAMLSKFMELGFLDTFRHLNPEPHNYTWWSSRFPAIREKNLGWRIDYQMISTTLEQKLQKALILPEAKHSDHCPVLIDIEGN